MQIAVALGRLGTPRARPTLTRLLGDASPLVRGLAARSLGSSGGRPELEALGDALSHESDPFAARLMQEATEAIQRALLGPPRGTRYLLKIGKISDQRDRRSSHLTVLLGEALLRGLKRYHGVSDLDPAPTAGPAGRRSFPGLRTLEATGTLKTLERRQRGSGETDLFCEVELELREADGRTVARFSGEPSITWPTAELDRYDEVLENDLMDVAGLMAAASLWEDLHHAAHP